MRIDEFQQEHTIRVLIVDDHPSMLWGLERLMAAESKHVTVVGTASSAAEALQRASETRPDVIMLDLDLGTESGIDIIKDLLAAVPSTRVLILTGVVDPGTRDVAILTGARGVVGKEESPENIFRAIEKVHRGELWLDRSSTGRVFVELSRALNGSGKSEEMGRIASLTKREREIVSVVSSHPDFSVKGIAKNNNMSEKTLRNHLTSIYDKLGVGSRLELHVFARKYKLDTTPRAPADTKTRLGMLTAVRH